MKRILFIFLAVFAFAGLSAQEGLVINRSLTAVTLQSDTATFAPGNVIDYYSGIVGFRVTCDTTNTSPSILFQGSFDNSKWYTISTTDNLDGDNSFEDTSPEYKYYRLYSPGASGDTCAFTNVRFFYKLPKYR